MQSVIIRYMELPVRVRARTQFSLLELLGGKVAILCVWLTIKLYKLVGQKIAQ